MLTMLSVLSLAVAQDQTSTSQLAWTLSVGEQPVGTRTLSLRVIDGDRGKRRILESFTEVEGEVAGVPFRFRQRLTGHAEGADPASFHSVVDVAGDGAEIQGRVTASGWQVTTNSGGRVRTAEYTASRIDLSTVDLLDPFSRHAIGRAGSARLLLAESGEVLQGNVVALGPSEVRVGTVPVQVDGYRWDGPEGAASFWFNPEGYLVKYQVSTFGVPITGVLTAPPPAGVDAFPVRVRPPEVERIPL